MCCGTHVSNLSQVQVSQFDQFHLTPVILAELLQIEGVQVKPHTLENLVTY